jgi:hypothetical protein
MANEPSGEIEITPEMVEAGEVVYYGSDFDPQSPSEVRMMIRMLYLAMEEARE